MDDDEFDKMIAAAKTAKETAVGNRDFSAASVIRDLIDYARSTRQVKSKPAGETIKVRLAVAVDSDNDWRNVAIDAGLWNSAGDNEQVHFIEADIPAFRKPPTVAGRVVEEPGT